MEGKARVFELRTIDGKPLISFHIYEKEVITEENPKATDKTIEAQKEKEQANSQPNNGSPMTDAQKRFLFRILAERGIENDKAHRKLKDYFQVKSLKDVTKLEASKLIEQLLEENKGGGDVGSPF